MKIIFKILLFCLLIHCRDNREQDKKEKAKRNLILCGIIAIELPIDKQSAIGITSVCGLEYSKAFKDD